MTSTYAYHQRVLRLLHSRRPPYRWLLKAPAYCFHLPQIAAQYSDARFLMTHRDPVAVFASTCSVVQNAQQSIVATDRRDPVELVGSCWSTVEMTRRIMAARNTLGHQRFYDVHQGDSKRVRSRRSSTTSSWGCASLTTYDRPCRPGQTRIVRVTGSAPIHCRAVRLQRWTVRQAFRDYVEYCKSAGSSSS